MDYKRNTREVIRDGFSKAIESLWIDPQNRHLYPLTGGTYIKTPLHLSNDLRNVRGALEVSALEEWLKSKKIYKNLK